MPANKKSKDYSKVIGVVEIIAVITILCFLTFFSTASSNLDVISGHIYLTDLTGEASTTKWGGDMGLISSSTLEVSARPFFARYIDSAQIFYDTIAGGNLNRARYNLVIMKANVSFNVSLLYNTTSADLSPGVLFPTSMYNGNDDPDKTFDCSSPVIFQINGENFSACYTQLLQNVNMGLLKYKLNTSEYIPVYIVDTSDYTCYNNSYCHFEFLIPVDTTTPYYYYHIGKYPQYSLRVWIDSVERTDFQQTALPYYVTVLVSNLYTGDPVPNIDVSIIEEQGNNIFVPLRMSGIISRSLSVTQTNASGKAIFIIAPTEYPSITNYSIKAGVIVDDEIANEKELSVTNALSISYQKKALSPSTLLDNAKVAVNAMNQISNSLYIWANSVSGSDSPSPEAKFLYVTVYTNGTYEPQSLEVQTGAPNVVYVTLKTPLGSIVSGYVKAQEQEGYLIMNPTYNATSTGYKEHLHRFFWLPTQQQFVITPTSYGIVNSSVKLDIYDSSYSYITTVNLSINPNLEPRSGSYYNDDDMKVIINAMAAVLNSLYYALN